MNSGQEKTAGTPAVFLYPSGTYPSTPVMTTVTMAAASVRTTATAENSAYQQSGN